MNQDATQKLNDLPTVELESIVHRGDNLHISTSRASQAQRILESRRHAEIVDLTSRSRSDEELSLPSDLTIFYSWQSDLPNKTNRSLIEDSLEIAVKKIGQDSSIKIVPRLDKDTAGVPGSPNIATIILDKIDRSFLVVSDVSIINDGDKSRSTPNPNVLYELGYAVKSLGMSNVVMVQNTAFGDIQRLPFDLKLHRILTYECDENGNIPEARKKLSRIFEDAIRLALSSLQSKTPKSVNAETKPLYEEEIKEARDFFKSVLTSNVGFWEFVAHPVTYNPEFIQNPVDAGNLIEQSVVHLRGWDLPHVDRQGNHSNFGKGKQSFTILDDGTVQEAWRMYKSGLFVWKDHHKEDLRGFEEDGKRVLYFVSALYSLTEIMLFLKRMYAEKLKVEILHVELTLNGCKGRMLSEGQRSLLHRGYISNEEAIKVTKNIKVADLEASFEEVARTFIKEIFMLFNWNDPTESMLIDWQQKLLKNI